MPKQYTEEEQIELILKALEPRVGERAKMKRNLVYMKTSLGGRSLRRVRGYPR